MKILTDSDIQRIINTASKRQINFLLAACHYFGEKPKEPSISLDIKRITEEYLKANQPKHIFGYGGWKEKIISHLTEGLIEESKLDWITDDETLNLMFSYKIIREILPNSFIQTDSRLIDNILKNREKTIALYDALTFKSNESAERSLYLLRNYKTHWRECEKEIDRINWLNGIDSHEALEFLHRWLKRKEDLPGYYPPSFEKFSSAAVYLIENLLRTPQGPILLLNAKKAWDQKKYRALPDAKKQCNLSLPEDSIKKLNRLAKENQINRSELIEFLINYEIKYKKYTILLSSHKKMLIEGDLTLPDKFH